MKQELDVNWDWQQDMVDGDMMDTHDFTINDILDESEPIINSNNMKMREEKQQHEFNIKNEKFNQYANYPHQQQIHHHLQSQQQQHLPTQMPLQTQESLQTEQTLQRGQYKQHFNMNPLTNTGMVDSPRGENGMLTNNGYNTQYPPIKIENEENNQQMNGIGMNATQFHKHQQQPLKEQLLSFFRFKPQMHNSINEQNTQHVEEPIMSTIPPMMNDEQMKVTNTLFERGPPQKWMEPTNTHNMKANTKNGNGQMQDLYQKAEQLLTTATPTSTEVPIIMESDSRPRKKRKRYANEEERRAALRERSRKNRVAEKNRKKAREHQLQALQQENAQLKQFIRTVFTRLEPDVRQFRDRMGSIATAFQDNMITLAEEPRMKELQDSFVGLFQPHADKAHQFFSNRTRISQTKDENSM